MRMILFRVQSLFIRTVIIMVQPRYVGKFEMNFKMSLNELLIEIHAASKPKTSIFPLISNSIPCNIFTKKGLWFDEFQHRTSL